MKKPIILLLLACGLNACSTWHLATADKAYDRMAYARAVKHYEKALQHVDDREARTRLAESLQRQGRPEEAAKRYAEADRQGPLEAVRAFEYGRVLMSLGRREEARQCFLRVLSEQPENGAAQDLLASCQDPSPFYRDTAHFTVGLLPLRGTASAFGAVPYKDGVVFAGEQDAADAQGDPWSGASFLDLYFARKNTLANWDKARPLPGDVNGRYHDGPAVFSADGRTMYFTRSNYYKYKLNKDGRNVSHLKLFRADLDANGTWGNIHEFRYNGEDFSVGHAALSADGLSLYFASDRPGSVGGSDLWRCLNNGTGWGPPENLGPTVNTAGDELFPTVVGDALYFSSTALQNMGGLDIFSTHLEGAGWSRPENLGYPINSTHDDFNFVMNSDGKTGYLSSDRSGTDRIHAVFVNEPIFYVEGFVLGDTMPPYLPHAEVTLTDVLSQKDTSMVTGSDGKFRFPLDRDKRYNLKVKRPGMLTQSRDVSTQGAASAQVFHEEFHMDKVELEKAFVVNNIYFDYDMWDIRPDAAVELNKLARLFNDNPGLSFELSSHTDSRAGNEYNLVLSDMRANSTVDYLIRAGVDPARLTAKGYGESRLVNHCSDDVPCTEEEHQQNRRTEFKVIKVKDLASSVP